MKGLRLSKRLSCNSLAAGPSASKRRRTQEPKSLAAPTPVTRPVFERRGLARFSRPVRLPAPVSLSRSLRLPAERAEGDGEVLLDIFAKEEERLAEASRAFAHGSRLHREGRRFPPQTTCAAWGKGGLGRFARCEQARTRLPHAPTRWTSSRMTPCSQGADDTTTWVEFLPEPLECFTSAPVRLQIARSSVLITFPRITHLSGPFRDPQTQGVTPRKADSAASHRSLSGGERGRTDPCLSGVTHRQEFHPLRLSAPH